MITGFPISAKLPDELGLGERFWYWRGVSGRTYIHSIYSRESCPPLPGAVFLVVRKVDGLRKALAVGRFSESFDRALAELASFSVSCEIHVHLLARDAASARAVLEDLSNAFDDRVEAGCDVQSFSEATQQVLVPA